MSCTFSITGNYSRLVCEIQFIRSMGYYLIQIYIPASLIVIISWVSFWLHRNASPARVALGVTTVLTMTTLMSSTNAALPKISYIKSIDVFLGTCFVMVFAALLEYATVGYLGKRVAMRKARHEQLAKLAQEHRKKCNAAVVAANAAQLSATSEQKNPILCTASFDQSRSMSVKTLPVRTKVQRSLVSSCMELGRCETFITETGSLILQSLVLLNIAGSRTRQRRTSWEMPRIEPPDHSPSATVRAAPPTVINWNQRPRRRVRDTDTELQLEESEQDVRSVAVRYRQIFPCRVPRLLHLFQPHVLGYLFAY